MLTEIALIETVSNHFFMIIAHLLRVGFQEEFMFRSRIFLIFTGIVFLMSIFISCQSDDDDDDGSGMGSLTVESSPSGAYITLDGNGTGRSTPSTINDLQIGVHTLMLTLEGYHDYMTQVTITEDENTYYHAQMTQESEPTATPSPTPQPTATFTPTQSVPTATPTPDPGQLPNLHPISIQTSGGYITSFTWENNGAGTITERFNNMIYVNVADPPYHHWQFSVDPPVAPGVYTTNVNIAIPSVAYEICLLVDPDEWIDEVHEGNSDNFYCRNY